MSGIGSELFADLRFATTPETWDAEAGSFTYDTNGNLKAAPAPYSITAVTYGQQDLPITITAGGTTTNYRYDQTGQRITRQVGTGNAELYLLDGSSPLGVSR
jgi:YD repeat-containing protein